MLGFGVGPVVVPVVVVDVEVEVEVEVGVLEVVVLVPELVVVVVVVVVLVVDVHDSVSDRTTPVIGRLSVEMGVPGGTFTLNVKVFPPRVFTVIVQGSAEAVGSASAAMAANAAATSVTTNDSFRQLGNVALLLLEITMCAAQSVPAKTATWPGRY